MPRTARIVVPEHPYHITQRGNQGRFYSFILDTPYLIAAMRYVERNPVRAKRVKQPWQWQWASAPAHVGQADGMVSLVELREFIEERVIRQDWIDRCLTLSEKIEDHKDGTRHFLARIEEHGNRWLRVVIDVTVEPNKTIPSFFDRRMKTKP